MIVEVTAVEILRQKGVYIILIKRCQKIVKENEIRMTKHRVNTLEKCAVSRRMAVVQKKEKLKERVGLTIKSIINVKGLYLVKNKNE